MSSDVPRRLLVTIDEAADILAIGRSKLYELLAAGDLRVVRIGRSVRIPVTTLEAYTERLAVEQALDGHR